MADHHGGDVQETVEVENKLMDGVDPNRVESSSRFIKQQKLRLRDQRPRQRDSLAHAAGELGRELLIDPGEAHLREPFMDFLANDCLTEPGLLP